MMKREKRERIHARYGGRCAYCGCEIGIGEMEADHLVPRFLFERKHEQGRIPEALAHLGRDDVDHEDNLMPSCRTCNRWKSTLTLEKFRRELGKQLERARRYSSNYRMALRYGMVEERPGPVAFHFEREG